MLKVYENSETLTWWQNLSEDDRKTLEVQWDERLDSSKFNYVDNEFNKVPVVIVATLTDEEEQEEEWNNDLYNFLVNHEILFPDIFLHIGGVCNQAKSAIDVLGKGFISKNFSCSFKSKNCSIVKLIQLVGNKSIKLKAYYKEKGPNQRLNLIKNPPSSAF